VGDPVVRRGPSGSLGQPGDWSAGSLRALSRWRSRSRSAAGVTALSPKCAANASATVRMVRSSSTVCGKLAKCSMSSGFGAPEASHSPRGTPGPPSPAGRRSHRYKSAGANPASTGHGARRTGQHRAVPQQAYVLDAVRARRHSGDQARDFQMRVDAALASRRDVLRSQVAGPARCAKAITGTSPACDTRFGSSKDPCVFTGYARIVSPRRADRRLHALLLLGG
jgi:hypothetical protein